MKSNLVLDGFTPEEVVEINEIRDALRRVERPEPTGLQDLLTKLEAEPVVEPESAVSKISSWSNRFLPSSPLMRWTAVAAVAVVFGILITPTGQVQTRSSAVSPAADAGAVAGVAEAQMAPGAPPAEMDRTAGFVTKSAASADKPVTLSKEKNLSFQETGPSSFGLAIDRSADMEVRVADVPKTVQAIEAETKVFKGFVASSDEFRDFDPSSGEIAGCNLELRIPTANFDRMIAKLSALGEVFRKQTSAVDITSETVDTEARLKALRAEEQQLMKVMDQTRTVKEILLVREQLSAVRQNIEGMEAMLKSLKTRASLSTIRVTVRERPKSQKPVNSESWSADAFNSARESLTLKAQNFGRRLIYAGVYSPIWVPPLVIGVVLYRRSRKKSQP